MEETTKDDLPPSQDDLADKEQAPPSQPRHHPQLPSTYYYCPTCYKPYYNYYKEPKKSDSGKKFLRVPVWMWVIILSIIVVTSCFIVGVLLFPWDGPPDHTETYSTEVIIAQGGHFKYTLGYFYTEDEITLNISSQNGETFDVYIMDEDQYENAYNSINLSIIAFSAFYSSENVDEIVDTVDLSEAASGYGNEYFLVIDNRNTPLTPNDASPEGPITVEINLIITSDSYYY